MIDLQIIYRDPTSRWSSGRNMIYAGHGATRPAIALGLTSIPTISLAHLSEGDRRAYPERVIEVIED